MRENTEKQKTSVNYNVNFYVTVQQLIASYAEYEDGLLQMEAESKANKDDDMDINRAKVMKEYNSILRKSVTTVQIHYETLTHKDTIKEKAEDGIKIAYKELLKEYMLNRDKLRDYILLLNHYVVNKLMPELAQDAQLQSIYN